MAFWSLISKPHACCLCRRVEAIATRNFYPSNVLAAGFAERKVLPSRLALKRQARRVQKHPELAIKKPGRKNKHPTPTRLYIEARRAAWAAAEEAARQTQLPWRMILAGLIDRRPVIIKEPPAWESEWMEAQEELMRYGTTFPADTGIMGSDEIYEKMDDQYIEELPFKLAPRILKADRTNDRTTLNRALADRLYLLIKNKKSGMWDIPKITVNEKGPFRPEQQRLITHYLGDKFEGFHPSNAPVGFHWITFAPERAREAGVCGEKVYIYYMEHVKGRGQPIRSDVAEHVWVNREEAKEYISQHDEDYRQLVGYLMAD